MLPLSTCENNIMEVQPDFKELLVLFNTHHVEYMIVGGYALAFHGAPRYTGDLDLFVKPDPHNAQQILTALTAFGFGSLGLATADFDRPDKVVQLGVPPVRVDIITSISGVTWEKARSGCEKGSYGDIPVQYIGREDFLQNKRMTQRKKDLADVEALGEA